jgi:KTSC domain
LERIPVGSSIIVSIGYDETTRVLEIEFMGGALYQYYDVPIADYQNLLNAPSVGKYFQDTIKSRFRLANVSSINFREIEFIHFLSRLISANSRFSELELEPIYRDINGKILRPDLVCKADDRKLIIEVKRVSPLIERRVKEYIDQLNLYKDIASNTSVILAIPDKLQENYLESFEKQGIEVWDSFKIGQLFSKELEQAKDSPLYAHFAKLSPAHTAKSKSEEFIYQLKNIKPGKKDWSQFQKLCINIFEYLFTPPLEKPLYELSDETRTNRRDIIFPNYADNGFWKFVRDKYCADYVVIDAKNYSANVEKKEVLQISNYLKPFGTGLFGIIVCRKNPKLNAIITQREHWMAYQKLVIFLNDNDIIQMLTLKEKSNSPEDVIRQKIEEFRLSL